MSAHNFRRLLWLIAWLIWLPVTGYGISTGNLILAFVVGPPLFLASLYYSLHALSCENCGATIRTISLSITHCMKCGSPYGRPQTDAQRD